MGPNSIGDTSIPQRQNSLPTTTQNAPGLLTASEVLDGPIAAAGAASQSEAKASRLIAFNSAPAPRNCWGLAVPYRPLVNSARAVDRALAYPIAGIESVTGSPVLVAIDIGIVVGAVVSGYYVGYDNQNWQYISNTGLAVIQAIFWFASVYADKRQFEMANVSLGAACAGLRQTLTRLRPEQVALSPKIVERILAIRPTDEVVAKFAAAIKVGRHDAACQLLLDDATSQPITVGEKLRHAYAQGGVLRSVNEGLRVGLNGLTRLAGSPTAACLGIASVVGLVVTIPAWGPARISDAIFWANFGPQVETSLLVDVFRNSQKQAQAQQAREMRIVLALQGIQEHEAASREV